jgi:hypothetical protein
MIKMTMARAVQAIATPDGKSRIISRISTQCKTTSAWRASFQRLLIKALGRPQLASEILPSARSTACTAGPPTELLILPASGRQLDRMTSLQSLMATAVNIAQAVKIWLASTIHRSAQLVAAIIFQETPKVSDSLNVVEGISDHRRYIIKKTV